MAASTTTAAGFALAAAAPCAVLMGLAIQRGATCTVAAVDELLTQRRSQRLRALAEAALWVALGLLGAQALRWLPALPPGHALTGWTLAGGLLLGGGAFVNRACVFGAIARLGSGEWAYAATPLGFLAGSALASRAMAWLPGMPASAAPLGGPAPVLALPPELGLPLALFALLRAGALLHARRWSPAAATLVIGLTFLALLLLAGSVWAYTDALAELARGMAQDSALRAGLFACLLAGAMLGGWQAGRWRPAWPAPTAWLRCFAGGAAMALGSALIPGSNDGLILVGMPLLWPYAWAAFGAMCLAIAGGLWLQARRPAWPP